MSFYYCKVVPEPEITELYGFKKVSKEKLADMVTRLAKTTRNTWKHDQEAGPVLASRPSSQHSRPGSLGGSKKFSEREVYRLLQRLQKPTRAYELARRDYVPIEVNLTSTSRTTTASRPLTATEREKSLIHLSRPTTASRGKHATECHLCDETDRELNKLLVPFEYPYADEKNVTSEEVIDIVAKVSVPTMASERGSRICHRCQPDYESLHKQSKELPLVSGLPRSKSVVQIVNRLHYDKQSKGKRSFHDNVSQSTQVTGLTTTVQ